jgi:ribosome-binding factor A
MITAYRRCDRIADLLQQELADLLLRRVKDPRVEGVTITGVKVSGDLQHARVFFCVMGAPAESGGANAAAGLEKAKGFLRHELGKRLHLRVLPQLEFHYDASFDYGEKIERLLKELHQDE